MNAQQMNFIALANTARECAGIANSVSGTMAWIVQHWNLCCQQAGLITFTTEARYTRRAQLAADMERMAAQLDNLANGCDALTGEKLEVAAPAAAEEIEAAAVRAVRREGAFCNFWHTITDMDITEAAQEWERLHAEALEMNDAADLVREAIRIANRDHGHWITGAQVAAMLADGKEYTAEQLARAVVNQAKEAAQLEQYAAQLTTAQQDYNTAADASDAALTAAVDASTDGTEDTPEFTAYEAAEAALMDKTTALLQACGRYSVELARRVGKPVSDIEALKQMFSPYFTGNTENVHPGRRNELVSKALEIDVRAA